MPTGRLGSAWFVVLACGWLVACEPTAQRRLGDHAVGPGRFAIVVDAAEGIGHDQLARQKAQALTVQTGLAGFWADSTPTRSFVYFGRYPSADAPAAESDLKRLKRLAAQGKFRPRFVALVAVGSARAATDTNPLNLRNAHPDSIYTVLVGAYDHEFDGDRRAAAETEAQRLRDAGFEAFFLHDPHRSLVTVGAFYHGAYRKVDLPDGSYEMQLHPYIVDLIAKPRIKHLKHNGVEVERPTAAGQTIKTPSTLIRIPGK